MSKTEANTTLQRIDLLLAKENERVKVIAANNTFYVKIFDDRNEVAYSLAFPISIARVPPNFVPKSAMIFNGDVSDELLDLSNVYSFRNSLKTKAVEENVLSALLSDIENDSPAKDTAAVATSSREYGELLAKDRNDSDFAEKFAYGKNDKSAKCQDAVHADVFSPTTEFTTKQAKTLLADIVSKTKNRIITQDEEVLRNNGSTFCGATVIAGEKPEDAKIVISNLGDSRAYLVLVDKKGKEILVSLSDDAELDKKRFRNKLAENGAIIREDEDETLRVCDDKGHPRVNMAAALGDGDVVGLIQEPEYTTLSLSKILEAPQFKGLKAKRVIVATDGVTKLEGYEGYPVDHYKPIVQGNYQDPKITGWKRVRGNDPANSLFGRITRKQPQKQEITAQSLTKRTQEHLTYDDVSAAEIRLDRLQKGQVAVAVACDGHGTREEGHLVAQALVKTTRELVGKEKEQALFSQFFKTDNENPQGKIFTFDNNQYAIIPPNDKYPDYILIKAVKQKTADGQVKTATVAVEPEEQKKVLEEITKQVKENNQKKTPQTQPQATPEKNVGYWTQKYGQLNRKRGALEKRPESESKVEKMEEKRKKQKDSTHEHD